MTELFPAIDIRAGRCVRLRQGDYADETVYDEDPARVARSFAEAGARWIHVVDLDAARDGGDANLRVIEAICAAATDCSVQTGGGIRSVAAAGARLEVGVVRVIVGSAAVSHPEIVDEIAATYPGAVAVGLDVRGRSLATHGWRDDTGVTIADLLDRFAGVGAIIATQIAVDGMLTGPDLSLYSDLLAATAVPIIASGGVGSLADLVLLRDLRVDGRGVEGVIAGKAIYEQRFSVAEGIAACSQPE